MNKGKIVQVMGPVVDVAFEDGNLPHIQDALTVMNNGKRCVMEVAQHIGGDVVRCIMLAASEGLCKDMEVVATGKGIAVPVGEKTLGRLFNVLGDTLDGDVYKRQAIQCLPFLCLAGSMYWNRWWSHGSLWPLSWPVPWSGFTV